MLASKLVPAGYFREYVKDNERWLRGEGLSPCDAGRYSVAIDSSGNVAPCLALPHGGNLLERRFSRILDDMDREAIRRCSDRSSCNMLCSRIVGASLRRPIAAARTPRRLRAVAAS